MARPHTTTPTPPRGPACDPATPSLFPTAPEQRNLKPTVAALNCFADPAGAVSATTREAKAVLPLDTSLGGPGGLSGWEVTM